MTEDATKPIDLPWEEAKLTLVYTDNGEQHEREVTFNRLEVEGRDRTYLYDQAPTVEAQDRAKAHRLSPDEFRERVEQTAGNMVSAPLMLPGPGDSQYRLIPTHQIIEVRVEVVKNATGIVIPSD